jgi:hypothetical protein
MGKVLNKFKLYNRAQKHYKPIVVFKVEKNARKGK